MCSSPSNWVEACPRRKMRHRQRDDKRIPMRRQQERQENNKDSDNWSTKANDDKHREGWWCRTGTKGMGRHWEGFERRQVNINTEEDNERKEIWHHDLSLRPPKRSQTRAGHRWWCRHCCASPSFISLSSSFSICSQTEREDRGLDGGLAAWLKMKMWGSKWT